MIILCAVFLILPVMSFPKLLHVPERDFPCLFLMFPKEVPLACLCPSCSQKRFLWHVCVPHVPKRGSSGMSMSLMFPKEIPLACLCPSCSQKRFLWHVCVPHVPKRGFSMSGPHFLSCASQGYPFSCSLRVPSCSFIKRTLMFLKGVPFSWCFFMFFHVLLGVILMFPEGSPFFMFLHSSFMSSPKLFSCS